MSFPPRGKRADALKGKPPIDAFDFLILEAEDMIALWTERKAELVRRQDEWILNGTGKRPF